MVPSSITSWCEVHGYTEPQFLDGQYWAFPPNAVMPVPIERKLIELPQISAESIEHLGAAFRNAAEAFSRWGNAAHSVTQAFQEAAARLPANSGINQFLKIEMDDEKPAEEKAAYLIALNYQLPMGLAIVRVREFRQRNQLDDRSILNGLREGKIHYKYGTLCFTRSHQQRSTGKGRHPCN